MATKKDSPQGVSTMPAWMGSSSHCYWHGFNVLIFLLTRAMTTCNTNMHHKDNLKAIMPFQHARAIIDPCVCVYWHIHIHKMLDVIYICTLCTLYLCGQCMMCCDPCRPYKSSKTSIYGHFQDGCASALYFLISPVHIVHSFPSTRSLFNTHKKRGNKVIWVSSLTNTKS